LLAGHLHYDRASATDGVGTAGGEPHSGAPVHAPHKRVINRTSARDGLGGLGFTASTKG
jgi:hypothetical protein